MPAVSKERRDFLCGSGVNLEMFTNGSSYPEARVLSSNPLFPTD